MSDCVQYCGRAALRRDPGVSCTPVTRAMYAGHLEFNIQVTKQTGRTGVHFCTKACSRQNMRKVVIFVTVMLACSLAKAQFGPNWSSATPPENGACFYEKPD